VYFAEEFSDPSRDLPRSLIGGVVAVVVLYLLINMALLHVLPVAAMAASPLPAAAAAVALVGPWGGLAITAVALVALLGLINTVVMAAPRILYGLGRDGLLPGFLAGVNAGGTPVPALLITAGGAALLVLAGSFERLLGMGAFLYVGLPLVGVAALLWLRRREPELERPFRSWGYPLTPLLVGAVSLAFLLAALWSDTLNSLLALALVAATLLVSGVNCLAASLSLLGLCSYVLLYTVLLKPRTPQNIVIGGVAGAIPPLVGAAAASGHLGLGSWWLFALVMVWTPAHFWALALLLQDDYRSVGIPMLPVVKGSAVTARSIGAYAWATVLLSVLGVWTLPSGGLLYGLLLLPFNARLLQMAWGLRRQPDDLQRAKGLFRWSILYLFGLCLLLLLAGDQFSRQGLDLLAQLGSGAAASTLAMPGVG